MNLLSGPILCASILISLLVLGETAQAQGQAGCILEQVGGTQRKILRCPPGITITSETGARFTLLDRDRNGIVDAATLVSKAIIVDAPQDGAAAGFEVLTPQAIAAVRGTRWAVDVAGTRTSVFVVRGRVHVERLDGHHPVSLGVGQGVDVDPGSGPLTVKRWSRARANALLERLGQ